MSAATLNITIEQGTKFVLDLYQQDDDGNVVPFPSNFDGARMDIRPEQDSPDTDIIHTLTTTNGEIVLDNVAGRITATIGATVTQAFTFECAVYDLELVDTSDADNTERYVEGDVALSPEVTRTTGN